MGVMAGDATEPALAPTVAPRQTQADGLEPGQHRVAATDSGGSGPVRVAVALAAETHELGRSPSARTQGERELGVGVSLARRRDVGPSRAVASLARDIGDHHRLVNPLVAARGELSGMTIETLPSDGWRGYMAVGRQTRRRWPHVLAGSESQRALLCEKGEPMLEDSRDLGVDDTHEGRGVTARAERIVRDAFLDLVRRPALYV